MGDGQISAFFACSSGQSEGEKREREEASGREASGTSPAAHPISAGPEPHGTHETAATDLRPAGDARFVQTVRRRRQMEGQIGRLPR